MVEQTFKPETVSLVARRHGVAPNQLAARSSLPHSATTMVVLSPTAIRSSGRCDRPQEDLVAGSDGGGSRRAPIACSSPLALR